MTESEARTAARMLHHLNRPTVAAPADPDDPEGEWRLYDRHDPESRRDITAQALNALARRSSSSTLPAGGRPVRGFVIPAQDEVA